MLPHQVPVCISPGYSLERAAIKPCHDGILCNTFLRLRVFDVVRLEVRGFGRGESFPYRNMVHLAERCAGIDLLAQLSEGYVDMSWFRAAPCRYGFPIITPADYRRRRLASQNPQHLQHLVVQWLLRVAF